MFLVCLTFMCICLRLPVQGEMNCVLLKAAFSTLNLKGSLYQTQIIVSNSTISEESMVCLKKLQRFRKSYVKVLCCVSCCYSSPTCR